MATAYMFGNALLKSLNKEINWASDTIKAMLCTSTYVPNQQTHIYKTSVTNEVAGTGYTARGAALGTKIINYYGSNTATAWVASTGYALGQIVRPTAPNGYVYACTVAGTSNSSAPTWPTTVGNTVTDGGVTWKNLGNNLTLLSAAATTWAASTITARFAVIYDDTGSDATSALIGYIDFASDMSSSNGNFTLNWDACGIYNINVS